MKRYALASVGFLIVVILVLPSFITSVRGESGYIDEFSEPKETAEVDSEWAFVTQDGKQRSIEVYKYCTGDNCVFVPFDVQNNALLDDNQTLAFFEDFAMKQILPPMILTNVAYSPGALGQGSLVCNFTAPRLDSEAKALVLQLTAEEIAPHLLPKNAARLVLRIYEAGEDVGLVESPSVPVLVLSASCVAGDFFESLAASALVTCHALVGDIRNNRAYQGQFEDLMGCHDDAVSKLEMAKNSPDILTQHLETVGYNWLQEQFAALAEWFCNIVGCGRPEVKIEESHYEEVLNQLLVLDNIKESYAGAGPVARELFSGYKARIELKKQEVATTVGSLDGQISSLESSLWRYNAFEGILDFFLKPDYQLSDANGHLAMAKNLDQQAISLQTAFKFNSAETAAKAGIESATQASQALTAQENAERHLDLNSIEIVVFMLAVLSVIAMAAWSKVMSDKCL
jgi:hypothetical protein